VSEEATRIRYARKSTLPFRQWLEAQVHREDPVGDFARDWLDDPNTLRLRTLSGIDYYLKGIGVCDNVLKARDRAAREHGGRWTPGGGQSDTSKPSCPSCRWTVVLRIVEMPS